MAAGSGVFVTKFEERVAKSLLICRSISLTLLDGHQFDFGVCFGASTAYDACAPSFNFIREVKSALVLFSFPTSHFLWSVTGKQTAAVQKKQKNKTSIIVVQHTIVLFFFPKSFFIVFILGDFLFTLSLQLFVLCRLRDRLFYLSCWMRSSPSLMTLTVTCSVVCCCWPNRLIRSCTASTDSAYTSSSSSFCKSSSHVHSYKGKQAGVNTLLHEGWENSLIHGHNGF